MATGIAASAQQDITGYFRTPTARGAVTVKIKTAGTLGAIVARLFSKPGHKLMAMVTATVDDHSDAVEG